jgi:hypothetical protein
MYGYSREEEESMEQMEMEGLGTKFTLVGRRSQHPINQGVVAQ